MPKKLLTNKKQAWVDQFKPTAVIKGTPLNYNAAIQLRYERQLERLVNEMVESTKKKITRLFNGEPAQEFFAEDASISSQARILTNALTSQFTELFKKKSRPLAEQMVGDTNKVAKSNLHQSLKDLSGGLTIKTDIMTGPLRDVMKATVSENVSLIRSIPKQYMTQVEGAVMRSISQGNGLQDLIPFLEKQGEITKRRAKNIALDQTRKAYNGINKGRMEALGVEEYEWLHSGGGQHPREEHIAMSGNIYRLDDPPVIDSKTGERGIPGQAINCKCRMRPVIRFNEGKKE